MRKWRIEDSEDLYNVKGWGGHYFSINENGHIIVTPKEGCASVDLPQLVDELALRDVSAPILVRFPTLSTTASTKSTPALRKRLPNTSSRDKTLWFCQLR